MSVDDQPITHRQRQAAQTRERIADAGRHLFARDGYGATSIAAIAAEAGVAVRTVYTTFGTKREIVSAICERWLSEAGAREFADRVMDEADPRRRIRLAAAWLTNLYDAGFDVVEILDAATDEDEQTRELLRAKLAGRNQLMDQMLVGVGDVSDRVQAIFRAHAAPGVYRELVAQSGWTAAEFADFVATALERAAFGNE